MSKKNNKKQNRREFIKQGLATTGAFMIAPRHVLGGIGYTAPSDKLHIGAIGAGGKGTDDIHNVYNKGRQNITALCDIDMEMAKENIKKFPKAKVYRDFRKMLQKEHKSLDAVIISAPDHIHGVAAMSAMQLGLHVYVQKPLTHNIYEARKLTKAARQYKIVSQMGNQGASNPTQKIMAKWFEDGKIGEVSHVDVWTDRPVWPQGIPVPKAKKSLPTGIAKKENWDLFIGPAEYVDYHPLYHPFKWRGWWNFGTGALGDMGCHLIDIPFRILKMGSPKEVECSVGQVFTKDWVPEYIPQGCPPSSRIQMRFDATPNNAKELTLVWYDGGIRPPHPEGIPASEDLGDPGGNNGVIMHGSKGYITCGVYGDNPKLYLDNGNSITKSKSSSQNKKLPEYGHHAAWCEAVKAGYGSQKHKLLTSSFDYAGPLTESILISNLAIRSYMKRTIDSKTKEHHYHGRKKMYWDAANMQITNFDEANEFVSRTYRDGWKLI